ncbi:uncharacterized protein [Dermacentor albipictus]|uniref:uncharacterized protein n=1 Tax=Dermacentor albipictus TaxID=60249 RepID=UPI0038FCC1BF
MSLKSTDGAVRLFREHEMGSTKQMFVSTSTGEGRSRASISLEDDQSAETALEPTPDDEDYATAVQDHGPSPGEPQPSPRLAVLWSGDEGGGSSRVNPSLPTSWDISYPRDTCSLYKPSWHVFWQVYTIYLVLMVALLLAHSQPWRTSERPLQSCTNSGCMELERVLAKLSNASVDACDDFYGHVCGGHRPGGEFRVLQQHSLYALLGNALSGTDPVAYPGDVRPLIYFYKRCLQVMKAPPVEAAEVRSLLAHYNLSAEVFELADRAVVIEHLARLATQGDFVPALRVRRTAALDSRSRNTNNSIEEECWLEPGSPSRLAILDAAIRSGQVAALLSTALQLTIRTGEMEQAADLRGNRSTDDGSEGGAATAGAATDVRVLLSDSPLWAAALSDSVPFLEAADFACRVTEPDTVSAELSLLEAAPLQSLRLYLLLCCTAGLLRSELRKFEPGFWAEGACVDDLRRVHRVQLWNRLLWLVVKPWNKDLQVREQVHAVRQQLVLYVGQSSAPFELKLNVTDALRNLSLAYDSVRKPEESSLGLEQERQLSKHLDPAARNATGEWKWSYYAMLDQLAARKAASSTDVADAALPQLTFNYTESRLHLSLGVLVPPSFDERYSKDMLAATLGFWVARAIVGAQRDVTPGWGLATCLSAQAGTGLSLREKDALFTAALAFKVTLDSALQLSGNRLATPREHDRVRLVFRTACASICSSSSPHPSRHEDERPGRRPPVREGSDGGWRRADADRTTCHAAVLNAPLFFRLFGCEPTSRMAQAGVCPLA